MQQELTEKQRQAIELIATGQNAGCIAETLSIRRETIWRWRQMPAFQAALDEQQRIFRTECVERMRGLVRLSLDALEKELQFGSGWNDPAVFALRVLKLLQPARLLEDKQE